MIRSLLLCGVLLPVLLRAQEMQLVSGTLTVAEGSSLRIEGPMNWEILPGAQVVNHGEIDLGNEANLVESMGWPITGSGVERATRTYAAPIANELPGGLGLAMDSPVPLGEVTVIRGHIPFALPNAAESVARWYRIESAASPGTVLELAMHYDPSELNGLDPTQLELHKALDSADYWNPLPGATDPGQATVSASMAWPWNFLTAFEQDVVTGMPGSDASEFLVFPTVTDGIVNFGFRDGEGIRSWELLDAHGRRIDGLVEGLGRSAMRADLSRHASGLYILRVNDTHVRKVVRP